MSEYREDLVRAAEPMLRRFGATTSAPAGFPGAAWQAVAGSGFSLLSVPEAAGGDGGDVEDLLALVEVCARTGIDLPLAEHALLAGWALSESGRKVPDGIMTAGWTDRVAVSRVPGGWRLSGEVTALPWLASAGHAVILITGQDQAPAVIAVLDAGQGEPGYCVEPATSIAGEPRDTLRLADVTVPPERVLAAAPSVTARSWRARGALARSVQLAGAARAILALTLQYTQAREQFGRPISRFQVVQHDLARLAAEVSAIGMAADAAVTLQCAEPDSRRARLAVAAAKSYASAAAGEVAAVAHQLHGALGFTQEYRLGWFTRRLWSWRDEFGTEAEWNAVLGRQLLEAGEPWAAITDATALDG